MRYWIGLNGWDGYPLTDVHERDPCDDRVRKQIKNGLHSEVELSAGFTKKAGVTEDRDVMLKLTL